MFCQKTLKRVYYVFIFCYFTRTGPDRAIGNHIQDLNRAIQYLQTLKAGLLTEEYDDLESEVQHAVDEHAAAEVKGNFEPYVPRSFQRL